MNIVSKARLIVSTKLDREKAVVKHPLYNFSFRIDTKSDLNFAGLNTLYVFEKIGYKCVKQKETYIDPHVAYPKKEKGIYEIDFPLYRLPEDLMCNQPFVCDTDSEIGILGIPVLEKCVVEILDDTINFYDCVPDEYVEFVPLKHSEDGKYYISLNINNKDFDYLLDTKSFTQLEITLESKIFEKDSLPGKSMYKLNTRFQTNGLYSDIRTVELPIFVGNREFVVKDLYVSGGEHICCSLNPIKVFKGTEFVIDLGNSRIGFKK